MNTHLITEAVRNSRAKDEAGIWDRLFAFWFRRLVYTQIWEDPEADLAALRLAPGATIVTISSGGCNALSYLAAKPAQVYAVDLNEAHLALLKLKLAGLRALPDYASFWQFFGEGSSAANADLYNFRLRPALDSDARGYWDERDVRGRPRSNYFTDGFYRHGALGGFIGFAHQLAKVFRIDLAALLQDDANSPARQAAMTKLHRLFHSRLARTVTRMPALLFSLGIPPQQRKLLGGDQPLNEVLHQRVMRLIDVHPNTNNYFAWQALARRYVGPGDACLPLYLQRSRFAEMQNGAGLVTPVHANLRVFLEAQPARQVNAVVLLDSQDWMAPDEIRALWNAIDRAGHDDVRVIFRTAGAESPLDRPELSSLRNSWRRDDTASETALAADRSGIYGGFHLYRRAAAA
jgi:S-adenosylmethionine-diacylglycerol 3-amino-3-carboxypropyl transferase